MAINIIPPKRGEKLFDENGVPTLRLITWIEDITQEGNQSSQIIDDNTGMVDVKARLIELSNIIGSGIPLTIDTTGFTVDTTFQFTDQTEV